MEVAVAGMTPAARLQTVLCSDCRRAVQRFPNPVDGDDGWRRRGLLQSTDWLRGLLAYVLGAMAFRRLGAWAVLIDLADISETAWRKRLLRASAWLLWLLGLLLAGPPAPAWLPISRRQRI